MFLAAGAILVCVGIGWLHQGRLAAEHRQKQALEQLFEKIYCKADQVTWSGTDEKLGELSVAANDYLAAVKTLSPDLAPPYRTFLALWELARVSRFGRDDSKALSFYEEMVAMLDAQNGKEIIGALADATFIESPDRNLYPVTHTDLAVLCLREHTKFPEAVAALKRSISYSKATVNVTQEGFAYAILYLIYSKAGQNDDAQRTKIELTDFIMQLDRAKLTKTSNPSAAASIRATGLDWRSAGFEADALIKSCQINSNSKVSVGVWSVI